MNPILMAILMVVSAIALVAWLFGVSEIARGKPWHRQVVKLPLLNSAARVVFTPFLMAMDRAVGAPPNWLSNWREAWFGTRTRGNSSLQWLRRWFAPPIALANAAEDGTHLSGILTKKSDAAIATRYLLGKFGSDGDHVAVAGAADIPLGVILDEASAAEEPVALQCIPCGSTIRVVTDGSGALVVGDLLIPAANGKVKKVAAAVGNQFIVGRVLTAPATVDGTPFEALAMGCYYNTAVS